MDPLIFSNRLTDLMAFHKTKQGELASAIGTSQSVISKLKDGQEPKANQIFGIAKFFNVSSDYLLGLTDSIEPASNSSDFYDTVINCVLRKYNLSSADQLTEKQINEIDDIFAKAVDVVLYLTDKS